MKIIAVLDLLQGEVVHGIGGNRASYRPISSRLTSRTDPVGVAQALRDRLGLDHLYLADLDSIQRVLARDEGGNTGQPNWSIYQQLREEQFKLWIDAGIQTVSDGERLFPWCEKVVVGLETILGPQVLKTLVQSDPERLVFSLDLREGQPMGELTQWQSTEAMGIAEEAFTRGVQQLLVLDVGRVGMDHGIGNVPLLRKLRQVFPDRHLIVGGGIRNRNHLLQLEAMGIDTVLMATALHSLEIQTW